jgi:hypothetical protein
MRELLRVDGIFDAAARGDARTVRALVGLGGADANAADALGRTPVWIAARGGHTQTVLVLLLEFGADVNAADENGRTPVFAAAANGDTEMVRTLVLCDADVSAADENGRTPVFAAAANGHTQTVRALAARGADESAADENGWTPVFAAAANGHTATVVELCERGADPVPALLTAALRADAEMTWRLVSECGVNPASRNRHGEKARDLVPAESNEYKLLQWLEGLQNHPPDLGPGASRTDKSIAYGEWFYHRNDTPCKEQNDDKRAAGFLCPLCRETSGDGIAFVPCGHRVCPGCYAKMRRRDVHNCPQCRAPIAHGMLQDSWPDRHPLYARFGVEVPLRGGPSAWR